MGAGCPIQPWLLRSSALGSPGPQSAPGSPLAAAPARSPQHSSLGAVSAAGAAGQDFWEGISGNEGGRAESFLICRSNICFVRIPMASNELNEAAGRSAAASRKRPA